MGRKVFISFLGTNNYLQTRYEIEGVASKPVRFVQEALCDAYCSDWPEDSRILICYTQESMKKNWLDGGQPRVQEDAEIENKGLAGILTSKPAYGNRVEGCLIPEGFSEEEVWSIFDTVYEKLQEDDEIYLDVTHAFRSIPLFSTVLFHYSHFMHNTTLCHVCYGAFEKLGPAPVVKQSIPDPNNRVAPVLSLDNLIQLQTLTQVANGFKQFGKIADIGLAFETGKDKTINGAINEFRSQIKKLDEYILTNKIDQIEKGDFVKTIKVAMKNLRKKVALTKAQTAILESLEENVAGFAVNGGIKNIDAAMQWALRYNMVQQAYTLARETILSAALQKVRAYVELVCDEEIAQREFVGSLLGISDKDVKNRNYRQDLGKNRDLTDALLRTDLIQALRPQFQPLANNRNTLCHAKQSDLTVEQFIKQLQDRYQACMDALNACESVDVQIGSEETTNRFLNLSNHPSSTWKEAQLAAARTIGDIVDLPFPDVPADATTEDIAAMVREMVSKVQRETGSRPCTVHVMGEMTFTFALVKALTDLGYRCVASTSQRMVEMLEDGTKNVRFEFCDFRDYCG